MTADRFIRSRWSKTRQRIHAMKIGEVVAFPPSQYFNAKQSVQRLNDAFSLIAKWRIETHKTKRGIKSKVTRLSWSEI